MSDSFAIALCVFAFFVACCGVYRHWCIVQVQRASYHDVAMMRQGKTPMRMISMSEADALQVQTILTTHAEMQDARILEIAPIIANLSGDESEDALDMVDDLNAHLTIFEEDAENLKRISTLFN